ncbi:hypothetical protein [Novosphingobium taihuense]|uniref:Uncharacterized protein n=1 Tax=Novosphingobium taihuense TaxID=260085 RepID=A0A7W7ADN8_9SPHN|nr:hypothetical protein [Novosphingobium taihuense]MBB4614355.1 hypothetical protein [Novosphingobium taihuense]TWH86402.1 hypothetical protein IQ25_01852 [Novosphingobium taihuense]
MAHGTEMARTIALIHAPLADFSLHDLARKTIVLGCAAALIMAGKPFLFF